LARAWHPNQRLAKTLLSDGTFAPATTPRRYTFEAVPLDGLNSLAKLLAVLLHHRDRAMVRGAIADPARVAGVRRLLHPDRDTGEVATLREVPRRWLALDMDELPCPVGCDPQNLADCAAAVRAVLPAPFRPAALLVQATAGHGFKPGLRLRVWAWLSRALDGAEAQRWLRSVPSLDLATLRPAQLIYTAAPVLPRDQDPLPCGRLHLDLGAEAVDVPDLPPIRRPAPHARVAMGLGAPLTCLERLVRFAASAPPGECNNRLYWAARRAAEMVRDGAVTEAFARAALAHAGHRSGLADNRVGSTLSSAFNAGVNA
jgi:hypothetical protein